MFEDLAQNPISCNSVRALKRMCVCPRVKRMQRPQEVQVCDGGARLMERRRSLEGLGKAARQRQPDLLELHPVLLLRTRFRLPSVLVRELHILKRLCTRQAMSQA